MFNLFQNILDKTKSNFANQDPTQNLQYKAVNKLAGGVSAVTGQGMADPTQSLIFKGIQGGANLYTGVATGLQKTAQADIADKQKKIDDEARKYASHLASKGYSQERIFQTLDLLKKEGKLTASPNFAESIVGGLGDRMGKIAQTTDRLSKIENPLERTAKGILPYMGQTVATPLQPITSGLEPYVSPVVQKVIEKIGQTENIQALSEGWSQFEKTNPILAENIAGLLNVSAIAPLPFAKPIANATTQGAKATGKAIVGQAENVAPKLVQGVTKAGGVVADITTAPFKSVYNTASKYMGTPEEISGIQSAIKPKQRVKNGIVQRNQKQIESEIQLTNGLIRNKGAKPIDIGTYATAQKDVLKDIGSEIERLTGQPLDMDITPSSAKIRQLANSDIVRTLDPADTNQLLALADRLDSNNGRMSLTAAEEMNQWLNSVLKDVSIPKSEAYKRGLQILVQDIREGLDNSISNIPGQFKELKKAYGAVRNVYGDTIARQIVFNRQNIGGLIDSFGAIEGFGNIASGAGKILSGKVGEGFVDIGKGVTQNAVGRFIKTKNDPNNIIKAIFEKGVNKARTPDIKTKQIPLLPSRTQTTPSAIPLGKSQAEIISDSKKGLSTNIKRPNGNTTGNTPNTSPILDMGATQRPKQKVVKKSIVKPK